jgi:ABC-2 type transport system ATP-binding protein
MAVIVSSHLLSEMEMMCDRIGIIQNGRLVDVQLVEEFIHGADSVYEFEVVQSDKAISVLQNKGLSVITSRKGITVQLKREEVPEAVKELTAANVQIFGIKEATKTLEDRFLEVTSEKGEIKS